MKNKLTRTQLLILELEKLCLEQKLHPSETRSWVKKQVRENSLWKGENPEALVMGAWRNLSTTPYL